jgi:hypothetical protein
MSQIVKYLVIDSRDRVSGTSTNFQVKLNPAIFGVKSIKLVNVVMPNSIYNFTNSNNYLYIAETGAGGGTVGILITPGCYTATQVATIIGQQLTSHSLLGYTYTCTYSTNTLKFTITSTGNFQMLMTSNNNYASKPAGQILGFNLDTSPALSQTGDTIPQLYQPTHIFIDIAEFPVITRSTNYFLYGTFFVNLTTNSGSIENWSLFERNYEVDFYGTSRAISELNIRLKIRNTLNQSVENLFIGGNDSVEPDLNGGDWTMVLELCYA